MNLHTNIRQQLQTLLAQPAADAAAQLNNALRLLSKWRSVLIQNTLLHSQGTVVMQGPLKGMDFLSQSAEGCYAVGMARRMPATQVRAFDLNPKAQETCRALAEKNRVVDRIQIGALFKPEDFATYTGLSLSAFIALSGKLA